MTSLRVLVQMARADFRERTRRYGFFVALATCVYAANAFLPPNPSPYATLQLGGHRGIYNSAWVGTLVALLTGIFLSLVGFYLVRNAVERDRQTRVGEILATTPLGRVQYTVGKTLSNFAVLATMTAVVAVAAGVVQVVRGEYRVIEPWVLVAPFLFLTLPVMLVTSALAVFFETTPGLRGGVGNIAYFFAWTAGLAASGLTRTNLLTGGNDLLGAGLVLPKIVGACRAAFPDYDPATAGLSMGLNFRVGGWTLTTYTWHGIHWTLADLAPRLLWVALALAVAVAAAIPFDRFDPARARSAGAPRDRRWSRRRGRDAPRAPTTTGAAADAAVALEAGADGLHRAATEAPASAPAAASADAAATAAAAHVTPLAPNALGASRRSRFAACVSAELRLTVRGTSRWWYVPWIVMAGFAIGLPLETARLRVLPLLWIWPVLLWSPLGTRERRHGVDQILFSAPHPLAVQLAALWASGAIIAAATGAPLAARLVIAGDGTGLFGWLVGAAFIPALALALGVWTGTSRAFEAIYTMLWYVGPLQPIPPLDFMGASSAALERGMPFVYLGITVILLGDGDPRSPPPASRVTARQCSAGPVPGPPVYVIENWGATAAAGRAAHHQSERPRSRAGRG